MASISSNKYPNLMSAVPNAMYFESLFLIRTYLDFVRAALHI